MRLVSRKVDLPPCPPILRGLKLPVNCGNGTPTVLEAVGDDDGAVICIHLDCGELAEQVI